MTDMYRKELQSIMAVSVRERFGRIGARLLRALPPEAAHDLGLWMLERGMIDRFLVPFSDRPMSGLRTKVVGVGDLIHPIGLAAGFDKNARAPRAFAKLGFSFLEIGTVTPRFQPGNPKPRLFRVPESRAIINRMGFNSEGAHAVVARLRKHKWSHEPIPLGINVGKNKTTSIEQAINDYTQAIEIFAGEARYFVVNISSPNTPGLRDLASVEFIKNLAAALGQTKYSVWVKLDPDMPKDRFQELIAAISEAGFQGLILSNTHRVEWPHAGGLSGHPLVHLSSKTLEYAYEVHKGAMPMIATGGIFSGIDVFERLARGACAVQIYTALVYRGPWVVARMLEELSAEMRLRGFDSVDQVIGSFYITG